MSRRTRRVFLQGSGAAVSAWALPERHGRAAGPGAPAAPQPIPRHQPLPPEGVHAYPRRESVAAGERLELCVSAAVPYHLAIVRLGPDPDGPARDEVVRDLGEQPARVQAIHPGSYVHVAAGLGAPVEGLTLEAWVRPFALRGEAAILSQYDDPGACGFALFANAEGRLTFYLGDGGRFRPEWRDTSPPGHLAPGRWAHVAATWDGRTKALFVDGREVARFGTRVLPARLPPACAPLRLGAAGAAGVAHAFLDADVALPAIHGRALDAAALAARVADRGRAPVRGPHVLAAWPLAEEQGARVADGAGHGRHGRIVNHGTWMVGGPGFEADVPRFGAYEPAGDPSRGHGLRLASDDLYDCGWAVTHAVRLPPSARPGLYVARLRFTLDGRPFTQDATFVVRRAPSRPRPRLLVLAATNTWRAYSGTPFGRNVPDGQVPLFSTDGATNSAGDPPAFNFYTRHAAGQGTYQLGLRLPWPAAGPYVRYGGPTDYSQLVRAERFTHAWLERSGYDYDLVSDLDLHRDPDQLARYTTFLLAGHSEYWSDRMYDGLERFLAHGGNLICLSGNTMFWRVTYDEAGTVIECRKGDAPGGQVPKGRRGELWHSHDGRRGGLMRESGRPGWRLVGLETLGWNDHWKPQMFGPYRAELPDHFLFQRPERVGVDAGEAFGQAPDGGLPRANGHEFDVRLSTLAALAPAPPPPGATMPEDPPGLVRIANGTIAWQHGGEAFDYFMRRGQPTTDQGAEMIYWERPDGGRVFNAGSVGFGAALWVDPRLQTLLRNVLAHFGQTPGPAATGGQASGRRGL